MHQTATKAVARTAPLALTYHPGSTGNQAQKRLKLNVYEIVMCACLNLYCGPIPADYWGWTKSNESKGVVKSWQSSLLTKTLMSVSSEKGLVPNWRCQGARNPARDGYSSRPPKNLHAWSLEPPTSHSPSRLSQIFLPHSRGFRNLV